jgi:uncharacterized membrane protein
MALMPRWLITMAYALASITSAIVLPRLEHDYLPYASHGMSVASAQAFLSSVTSGMMALTGIVFSLAFVIVQFAGMAYSPRLVMLFGRDPALFNSLGVFIATFAYALGTLVWVDRGGDGRVPLYSITLVAVLLSLSMIFLARLVQHLGELQITLVLRFVGEKGRKVIRTILRPFDSKTHADLELWNDAARQTQLGPLTQKVKYSGEPCSVTRFDIEALIQLAQNAGAIIVIECAVGDTLVDQAPLLRVYGAAQPLSREVLMQAIHLGRERTFEQDPK